ncbi:KAT8 regulatory NSL complex subunit 1-like isoform X1 [Penaeus chinensis]|uniref:KAT8 regulatory NSL complex subunit 1-like isoform X1 n=1 Tax=Penaeus chinensis TaxID=139456 RepID=UPI001FB7CC5E|nr:KAT8 regulatory NSL complex subunit 1-like isoform X1 [Penaeus chinensis]
MAPALTQASDPQTFHVTAHHHSPARPGEAPSSRSSPPPTAHLALQYGGLKEPHDCTDAHLAAALTNGTRRARLLPPSPVGAGGLACGREGCDPPPRPHAAHTTMDPPSGATAPTEDTSQPPNCCDSNAMGQDTGQQGAPGQQAPHAADHKAPRPPPQDGDLLALIGRDFANMNEIIDTLTRLADNPEVLAAVDTAALDLHGQCEGVPHQALDPQAQVRQVTKEERAHLLVDELDRRHLQIERRQTRLLRRLRRVTARGLGASVSGQLRELLDHAHGALAKQREHTSASEDGPAPTSAPEVGVEALRADAMRTMSTSALVNLVRRVEASQGLARLAAASHRPPRSRPPTPAPALPEHTRAEVAAVSAEVEAAAHAHTHHDSDATESSSGGESCDEGDGYNDTNTHHVPVRERALYRYCRARSWVASRWTWLQAQVADLEYRILQQQKIYAHVRNNKGAVQVEEGSRWRGMTLRDPAHLDVHDPALTCLAAPTSRTTVNGYHGRIDDGISGGVSDSSFVSARTQGLRAIKRRRLVRAGAGLCASHRRGAGGGRIPAVQCKCVLPLTCVLCTRLQGIVPPTAPPDPDTQPWNERHARVDPTFQPVLSQPADVSLSERFDAILKTTDWQRQVLTAKTLQPLPVTRTNRETLHVEKKKKKDKDRKKEYKKHKKEGKGRITLKLKKSLLTGEVVRDVDYKRKRISAQEALLAIKRVRVEEDDDASSVYGSSHHSSPSASPAPIDRSAHKRHSSTSSQKMKQSTSSNSYDIDNIVIPYSMAASTRVEKLEYKEIPTPKWRIVPLIPNNVHSGTSQEDEFEEDVSEEATLARHSRSEELERKKFLQHLHMQVTSRSSRSRRTDSSGTNTPDHPLSPRPPDPASDTISPLATPPTTPLAPSEDSNQSSSLSAVPAVSSASAFPTSSLSITSPMSTLSNSTTQLSGYSGNSQSQSGQLLVHNSQLGGCIYNPLTSSTSQATTTSLSTAPLTTSTSSSTPSSHLPGSRRNRTFSSGSRSRGFLGLDDSLTERMEGVVPYEQRVFPLNNAEYMIMVRETDDCDIGPPSPPLDSSSHEPINMEESGRSSPMSEVTDSAPEDDGQFDDTAEPKWTISGLKDATGQCVLQIHRN